jgi:hypothetical protein
MTKNLEKADAVVKLTLAVLVIVFYGTHVIVGPFARLLMILSSLAIVIFVVKFLHTRVSGTKNKPTEMKSDQV